MSGDIKQGQEIGIMAKVPEVDMFEDSMGILNEKTSVYIGRNETSLDGEDMLELHPDNWDRSFNKNKPLNTP